MSKVRLTHMDAQQEKSEARSAVYFLVHQARTTAFAAAAGHEQLYNVWLCRVLRGCDA